VAVLATACSAAHADTVASFAGDFSTSSPSSGAWQYGWAATLGGSFTQSTASTWYGAGNQVLLWSPAGTFWPSVGLNTSAVEAQFGAGNVIHLAPGQGLLHPGPTGAFGVARLTVPVGMLGTLQANFVGIDTAGTTTDVHVLLNGASLYDGAISGFGQALQFASTRQFAAGDRIDFAVGLGSNGHYNDDSTGFTATLSTAPVPEPGRMALLLAGLTGLGCWARARRTPR
jgi:hypothetical protein